MHVYTTVQGFEERKKHTFSHMHTIRRAVSMHTCMHRHMHAHAHTHTHAKASFKMFKKKFLVVINADNILLFQYLPNQHQLLPKYTIHYTQYW